MLTPQHEQALALYAMLQEQQQPDPATTGTLLGLSGAATGALVGDAANKAVNLGRRVRGKKPMGISRIKRPAGLALLGFALGGGAGYGIQKNINSTVPAAEAIAKAAMDMPLTTYDKDVIRAALAGAYSNQGQMSGLM